MNISRPTWRAACQSIVVSPARAQIRLTSKAQRGGHRAKAYAVTTEAQPASSPIGARSASPADGRSSTHQPAPCADAGFCPERRWVAGDSTPPGGGIASDSVEPHHDPGPCKQALMIPAHFHIRCFNCLSLSHCVATCQVPQRCLRCCDLGHIARDCCRPKATLNGGGWPHHACTDHRQPSQRASLDGTPTAYGTKMGVEGCPR